MRCGNDFAAARANVLRVLELGYSHGLRQRNFFDYARLETNWFAERGAAIITVFSERDYSLVWLRRLPRAALEARRSAELARLVVFTARLFFWKTLLRRRHVWASE